jgi:hypothetical protein
MKMPGRDLIGRLVFLAIGAAIGLRAAQVADWNIGLGSYYVITGSFVVVGLIVSVAFVGGLALWRARRRPDGNGGPRLGALAIGMILGALVGIVAVGAS